MNMQKLRLAESTFLERYPGGFQHPDMVEIGKKHRVDAVSEQAQMLLAKKNFANQAQILDDIIKVVSRSSMVSMFEKPKFRDYVNGLSRDDRAQLAGGFKKLLHGNQERGFDDIVDVLSEGKIAKWSVLTICLLYYRPTVDVFVKPTTTKNVLKFFEIDDLVYHPRPSWAFYESYRNLINEMKAKVDPCLSPNNAAFTGFLMITLNQ
jgi:hypothetical protein